MMVKSIRTLKLIPEQKTRRLSAFTLMVVLLSLLGATVWAPDGSAGVLQGYVAAKGRVLGF